MIIIAVTFATIALLEYKLFVFSPSQENIIVNSTNSKKKMKKVSFIRVFELEKVNRIIISGTLMLLANFLAFNLLVYRHI